MRTASLYEPNGRQIATFSSNDNGPWPNLDLMDITGWVGGVGVKDSPDSRFGHGMFAEKTRFTGRDLTIYVFSKYETLEQRAILENGFSGMLASGADYRLTVEIEGLKLSTTVQQDGEVDIAREGIDGLNFKIPLRAVDPFKYADEQQYQIFPAGYGEGLEFPLFAGGSLTYGTSEKGSSVPVRNAGTATAYPRIAVHGNWPAGFRIVSGRSVVQYGAPVVTASPVEIDMKTGSITSRGSDVTQGATRRAWFSVPPGGVIQPRISAISQGDGWADVFLADTYL